jgi:pimeloyl-ACP methyl ester carboxylesterase
VGTVQANGIDIEVDLRAPEAVGAATSRLPVLLIMGLGMQLSHWPPALIEALLHDGHPVIRFDNRDIGLSAKLARWGRPNLIWMTMQHAIGMPVGAGYTLHDMAADTVGVLDALGVPRAHVLGVSMGGMIGQIVAARHPERVASFTCVMSSSGARALPGPSGPARRALFSRPANPRDLESIVDHYEKLFGVIGSPGFPTPRDQVRERIRANVQRSHHPLGTLRQMAAIAATGDRSRLLSEIKVPVAIVHGRDDPLVPVAAAHDLARKIPGATLRVIDGMGHDLPAGVIPLLLEAFRTLSSAVD